MPYFIYRIEPSNKLTLLETRAKYPEARSAIRELRGQIPPDAKQEIRMIFANSQIEAERLLSAPREKDNRIIGDD